MKERNSYLHSILIEKYRRWCNRFHEGITMKWDTPGMTYWENIYTYYYYYSYLLFKILLFCSCLVMSILSFLITVRYKNINSKTMTIAQVTNIWNTNVPVRNHHDSISLPMERCARWLPNNVMTGTPVIIPTTVCFSLFILDMWTNSVYTISTMLRCDDIPTSKNVANNVVI